MLICIRVLVNRVTKQVCPDWIGGVWAIGPELFLIDCNGGEVVVMDAVVDGLDRSCLWVEDEGNGAGMIRGLPHIDHPIGARFPSRYCVSSSESSLKGVDRASPHMQVLEFAVRPSSAGEQVRW